MLRIGYDEFWKRMNTHQQEQQKNGSTYSVERGFTDYGSKLVWRLSNDAISRLIDEYGHRTDLTNRTFRSLLVAERDRRARRTQGLILFIAGATLVATCIGIGATIALSQPS